MSSGARDRRARARIRDTVVLCLRSGGAVPPHDRARTPATAPRPPTSWRSGLIALRCCWRPAGLAAGPPVRWLLRHVVICSEWPHGHRGQVKELEHGQKNGTARRTRAGGPENAVLSALWTDASSASDATVRDLRADTSVHATVPTVLPRPDGEGPVRRERTGRGHLRAPVRGETGHVAAGARSLPDHGTDRTAAPARPRPSRRPRSRNTCRTAAPGPCPPSCPSARTRDPGTPGRPQWSHAHRNERARPGRVRRRQDVPAVRIRSEIVTTARRPASGGSGIGASPRPHAAGVARRSPSRPSVDA